MIIGLGVTFQTNVFGCSCDLLPTKDSVRKQVRAAKKEAPAVLLGTVLEINEQDAVSKVVRIKVKYGWKGIEGEEVTILTGKGRGDCGYMFEVGKDYLIYASSKVRRNAFWTTICTRTGSASEANAEIKLLGRPSIKPPGRTRIS
jgi:hypothetical protein